VHLLSMISQILSGAFSDLEAKIIGLLTDMKITKISVKVMCSDCAGNGALHDIYRLKGLGVTFQLPGPKTSEKRVKLR
jgi:hypothetical protein